MPRESQFSRAVRLKPVFSIPPSPLPPFTPSVSGAVLSCPRQQGPHGPAGDLGGQMQSEFQVSAALPALLVVTSLRNFVLFKTVCFSFLIKSSRYFYRKSWKTRRSLRKKENHL